MTDKKAASDHPIHHLLAERWSPYAFSDKPVAADDLRSLFEAARWAASSYNEQPWRYIVATKDNPEEFKKLLSCLVEPNQEWAKNAPVLALGVVSRRFARNNQENRVAAHDLGLASANLVFEATHRGLQVHQMAGILPDKARELFHIPEHFDAWTALAIGYKDDPSKATDDDRRARDTSERQRKPLKEFVFGGDWGKPSPLTAKK